MASKNTSPQDNPGGQPAASQTVCTSVTDTADMPLDELRSVVQRGDVALRRALKLATVTSRELDDLRTVCAQRRIALRRREADEALRAAEEVSGRG